MIIINADDWGRTRYETDMALSCYRVGSISSATAMVFMEDSDRAAELADEAGIDLGLHLNLSQPFTGEVNSATVRADHECVVKFITSSKYSRCLYNPALRRRFHGTFQAQLDEFLRLYRRRPSHIDGHHHTHLCTNILLDRIIPRNEKVRRSFSFKAGDKGMVNWTYRRLVDAALTRRYQVTDYFFSLQDGLRDKRLGEMFALSRNSIVEVMTHPADSVEYAYLMSESCAGALKTLRLGTYSSL